MSELSNLDNISDYVLYLKGKANYQFQDNFKNRAASFFSKNFDKDGYILIKEENKREYFDIVNDMTDNKFTNLTSWFPKQSKLFLNEFYYETAFNASNRIEENIHYETVSKALYELSVFTLTPSTFEDFLIISDKVKYLEKDTGTQPSTFEINDLYYYTPDCEEMTDTEDLSDLDQPSTSKARTCLNQHEDYHSIKEEVISEEPSPEFWRIESDNEDEDIEDLKKENKTEEYTVSYSCSELVSTLNTVCLNRPISDLYTSLSYKLLMLGHLSKKFSIVIEHPNYALARVILALKITNEETIERMFNKVVIPSTPMFYNSISKYPLLSSCFLLDVEDNTNSISYLLQKIVNIQKHNSGIGINLSNLRSCDEPALGGATTALGIEKFVKTLACATGMYKNSLRQRSSSANLSLSLEHPEIVNFIKMKSPDSIKGTESTFNLFNTIKIPDEFMYRLLDNRDWYLISPNQELDGKSLSKVWGKEYSDLYRKMIRKKSIKKTKINSFDLYQQVIKYMKESGSPFQFYTDTVNALSNHKNYGMINGTNLCTEILEYHDETNTACCNIASINLKLCVKDKHFDFGLLVKAVEDLVEILSASIFETFYSHDSCKSQNLRTRPIGIGIQGLANMFQELEVGYLENGELYSQISEVIYYTAVKKSCELAERYGTCDPDKITPLSQGTFHHELFYKHQEEKLERLGLSDKKNNYNLLFSFLKESRSYRFYTDAEWETLRQDVKQHGIYNTLLIAYMPTSLSSGIYGNVENFEPYCKNIYRRSFAKYDVPIYNTYLVDFLLKENLCDENNVIKTLIKNNGDFTRLPIPYTVKKNKQHLFRTIYDFSVEDYTKFISLSNPFVDQGKSTNIYVRGNASKDILKTNHRLWLYGGKTTYYFQTDTDVRNESECNHCAA